MVVVTGRDHSVDLDRILVLNPAQAAHHDEELQSLPIYPAMTAGERDAVIAAVREICWRFRRLA